MLCAFFDVKQPAGDKKRPQSKLDKLAAAPKPAAPKPAAPRPPAEPKAKAKAKAPAVPAASADAHQRVYAQFSPLPPEPSAPGWDPSWASTDPHWSDLPAPDSPAAAAAGEWDYVWDERDAATSSDADDDEEYETWSDSTLPGSTSLSAAPAAAADAPADEDVLDRHFFGRKLPAVPGSAAVAVYTGPELCFEEEDFIY